MALSWPDAEARRTELSSVAPCARAAQLPPEAVAAVAAGSDAVAAQLSAVPAEPGVSAQQPVAAAAVRDAGEEPRQAAEAVVLPGAEAERLPVAASARSAA